MIEVEERPLLTFALLAYNQERYIREAVEGALAQTYQPLEIILSDDCSTDDTYEVMKEVLSAYAGPHRIHLRKNERNLGIPEHVSRVLSLASGEHVILAGGDDISLPHRCETVANAWVKDRKRMCIYTGLEKFSDDGTKWNEWQPQPHTHDLEAQVRWAGARVPGCTASYSRRLYEVFGHLPRSTYSEDRVLIFRAAILGSVYFEPAVTVRYRRHRQSVAATGIGTPAECCRPQRTAHEYLAQNQLALFDVFRNDLHRASELGLMDVGRVLALQQLIEKSERFYRLRYELEFAEPLAQFRAALMMLFTVDPTGKTTLSRKVRRLARVALDIIARKPGRRNAVHESYQRGV